MINISDPFDISNILTEDSQFPLKDQFDFTEDLNMEMFYTSSPASSSSSTTSCEQASATTSSHIANSRRTDINSKAATKVSANTDTTTSANNSTTTTLHTITPQQLPPPTPPTIKPPHNKKEVSEALTKFNFGRELPTSIPIYSPDPSLLHLNSSLQSSFKYQLQISTVPPKSRVETQIPLVLKFHPNPQETIIHLPGDTISKPKLQLKEEFKPTQGCLQLDTYVYCDSDPSQFVNICQGCMKRERKRASRKKNKSLVEEAHWNQEKRAIVFNCREVIDLTIDEDGIKQLELPMRLACYCRHHNEKVGFRALFVVKDYEGNIVAKGSTGSVMITDDHKTTTAPKSQPSSSSLAVTSNKRSFDEEERPRKKSSAVSTPNLEFTTNSPISPFKQESPISSVLSPPIVQKQSVDEWANSQIQTQSQHQHEINHNFPLIQRIIPGSGSIRGGIEVTLLGNNFVNGLVAKFGENRSMSTQCWNNTTIVTNLPPSRVAGPVVVTFEGLSMPEPQVFSYYDDTDRQLIELALQVVGLKMNGRLEDARDIARRIVGGGTGGIDTSGVSGISLDKLDTLLLKCMDLIESYESDYTPNFQLTNAQGQTMLHLCACLGLDNFTRNLVNKNVSLDIQDKSGFTALHFAALHGHDDLIELFLENGANPDQRTYTKMTYKQLIPRDAVVEGTITANSFIFNDGSDVSELSDVTSEDEASSPEPENEEDYDGILPKSLTSYFASWKDFRLPSPSIYENVINEEHFWNFFYKNFYQYYHAYNKDGAQGPGAIVDSGAMTTENHPPSYEEIYPLGSSSAPILDYSNSLLDDHKPVATAFAEAGAIVAQQHLQDTTTDTSAATSSSSVQTEEDLLQAWRNKRKKIQNDRMFLFFWLPVFVFMLMWVSMKLLNLIENFQVSERLHNVVVGAVNWATN